MTDAGRNEMTNVINQFYIYLSCNIEQSNKAYSESVHPHTLIGILGICAKDKISDVQKNISAFLECR